MMMRQIRSIQEIKRCERRIRLIVVHCSATRSTRDYTPAQLEADHRSRGFAGAGYHYYITRAGLLYEMRDPRRPGAHVAGHNSDTLAVCYEGGLDADGAPEDTRTSEQKEVMRRLLDHLRKLYGAPPVVGHRDLSPDRDGDGTVSPTEWLKACPCFDAKTLNEWRSL